MLEAKNIILKLGNDGSFKEGVPRSYGTPSYKKCLIYSYSIKAAQCFF